MKLQLRLGLGTGNRRADNGGNLRRVFRTCVLNPETGSFTDACLSVPLRSIGIRQMVPLWRCELSESLLVGHGVMKDRR